MTARCIGAALGALMLAAAPGSARAETAQVDGWRFALTPYIWFAGVAGEATLPRQSRDFDAVFGDVLSKLDCRSASNRDPARIALTILKKLRKMGEGGVPIGADWDPTHLPMF
jgi:hypothetical protein